ncbi:hypothetical protein BpHYR1_003461 [Brachionus plicatilis]|uniref:Uncharacterized protein n=1 Tax=Brachionus plicatilis TaxID=10195 RepID=A0A3M7TAQ4_BRAPC|nr:hypothetical protein BpHYR1_003461 [Brachionus plicatilis]
MEQATETERQKEERLNKKKNSRDACKAVRTTFHSKPVPSMPVSNLENEHSDDENLGKNDQSQNKNDGRGRGRGRGGRGENCKNIAHNQTFKTKGGTQRGRKQGRV